MQKLIITLLLVLVTGASAGEHLFILTGEANMVHMSPDHPGSFTETAKNRLPGDSVTVIHQALGDRPISKWDEGTGMWKTLATKIDAALAGGKKYDSVTLVWMQGEKDANSSAVADVYESKLLDVYDRLKAYVGVKKMYWVIGRLNDARVDQTDQQGANWRKIRAAQQFVGNTRDYATWVDFDDLNDPANKVHLYVEGNSEIDPEAYAELGARWANAAADLMEHAAVKAELYRMPLHFTYGGINRRLGIDKDTKEEVYSEKEMLNAFEQYFGPGNYPTHLQPVLLNVDPAKHKDFLDELKKLMPKTKVFFGLGIGYGRGEGQATRFPRDYEWFMEKAAQMAVHSDCIRIEIFDNLLEISGGVDEETGEDLTGEQWMVKMLHELHYTHKFKHIMLNPWAPRPRIDPDNRDDENAKRPWPFVDSGFIGTGSKKIATPYSKIAKLYAVQPDAVAIVNYENAGMHMKLAAMEAEQYLSSTFLVGSLYNMASVANRQQQKDADGEADIAVTDFKWCPPWSSNYDALTLDTLGWIAKRLIELNPPKNALTSVPQEIALKNFAGLDFVDADEAPTGTLGPIVAKTSSPATTDTGKIKTHTYSGVNIALQQSEKIGLNFLAGLKAKQQGNVRYRIQLLFDNGATVQQWYGCNENSHLSMRKCSRVFDIPAGAKQISDIIISTQQLTDGMPEQTIYFEAFNIYEVAP